MPYPLMNTWVAAIKKTDLYRIAHILNVFKYSKEGEIGIILTL